MSVANKRSVAAIAPGDASWLIGDQDEQTLRIALARKAQKQWAQGSPRVRAQTLSRVADQLLARQDEIVELIHQENGKPRVEALSHELTSSVGGVRWLCGQGVKALAPQSVLMPYLPHRRTTVEREPLGLVLIISPWNFPLSIPLAQAVAALLAGNAVILKPSEVTPRCGELIGELFAAARLPPNLFQVILGDGGVGAQLIEQQPDKVLFTGSLATGRRVMESASRFPIEVSLELGGVDALVVLDDADLDLAASAAVWGGFFNGGQVCASVERVLVHRAVIAEFRDRLLEKARQLEPARDLAGYTADKQRAVYEAHLADGTARGLQSACGGQWIGERMLAPTVLEGDGIEQAEVFRQETFGPVVALRAFRHEDEAVALHNALGGGLTASIFSADHDRAQFLARRLEAGLVSINDVGATLHAAAELPWGGVGNSGFGRSHGVEGLLALTRTKVLDQPRTKHTNFKRPWWFPYDPHQQELMAHYTRFVGERAVGKRAVALAKAALAAARMLVRTPRI